MISEETRQKMSESHKGKHYSPMSEQGKRNIAEAHLGKHRSPFSDQWIKNLSDAALGRNSRPIGSEYITLEKGSFRTYIKTQDGWMLRSRYVMEQHLGRKLESYELVHHRDGNTLNDELSNLEVTNREGHCKLHSPRLGTGKYST